MGPVVEKKIEKNLRLTPDSKALGGFVEPPVNPMLFFYAFNLTNLDDFLAGRDKPRLVELGPYTYRSTIGKTNVEHSDGDNTIGYTTRTVYQYAPEYKPPVRGTDDSDMIVVPNIPLFGAMLKMKEMGQGGFALSMFQTILESYDFATDTTPFLTLSVRGTFKQLAL